MTSALGLMLCTIAIIGAVGLADAGYGVGASLFGLAALVLMYATARSVGL